MNGSLYRASFDTLRLRQNKVDVLVCKEFFNMPYYLPDNVIDRKNRNKTLVTRAGSGRVSTQSTTYIYDSIGRIISYAYSSCLVCSVLPYQYVIVYNTKGQIYQIKETKKGGDRFVFSYNVQGNIYKLEKYVFGELDTVIESMN